MFFRIYKSLDVCLSTLPFSTNRPTFHDTKAESLQKGVTRTDVVLSISQKSSRILLHGPMLPNQFIMLLEFESSLLPSDGVRFKEGSGTESLCGMGVTLRQHALPPFVLRPKLKHSSGQNKGRSSRLYP